MQNRKMMMKHVATLQTQRKLVLLVFGSSKPAATPISHPSVQGKEPVDRRPVQMTN